MKTPKEFTKNLRQNIITKQMLADALFSVNKRAKNYRDKMHQYDHYFGCHHYREINETKMNEMYDLKEKLLTFIKPTCIHKQFKGYSKIRIYDYQQDQYNKIKDKDVIWQNCYFDHDEDRTVWFKDIENKNKKIYLWYIFYDLGKHSFHTPIEEYEVELHKDLKIVEIDSFYTYGEDTSILMSVQFAKTILSILKSGNYILQGI